VDWRGTVLTATELRAHNSFDHPDALNCDGHSGVRIPRPSVPAGIGDAIAAEPGVDVRAQRQETNRSMLVVTSGYLVTISHAPVVAST